MESLARLAWIGIGGAVGSVLRYLLAGWVQRDVVGFPLGTLAVNVLGCAVIGYLSESFLESSISPTYRTAILVGLLGGFTTFSAFSLETLKLGELRQYGLAIANVIGSLTLCLSAAWAGQRIARWMVR